ncbi:Uncharacterized protein dnm_098650 [Desulfonema magnum]|uniref:Uncharacterized protein n=1 Tax=Desulfonema magnum TaxID=45655 RepID=A0A975C0G7_9BACT|nr:Uncharacterized protein dnm_098650 [Desulfonema magnum]
MVSIHAPRAGSDSFRAAESTVNGWFQSTPPVRGATNAELAFLAVQMFQSTPPVRGATR